jgi:hypothetical protein
LILELTNIARFNNFIHKTFTSPAKYYQFVEKKAAKELADSVGEVYASYLLDALNIDKKSVSGKLSVELDEDGEELLGLAGLAGVDLSWLESVDIRVNPAVKNNVFNVKGSASVNGDSVISGKLAMDMEDGELYVQIPELTKTYLGVELEETLGYDYWMFERIQEIQANNKTLLKACPSQNKMEKLLKKYLLLAMNCVDDVSKSRKSIKADGVQQTYTELKVVIDSETMQDIAQTVLEELASDTDIEEIIVDMIDASGEDLDADEVYEELVSDIEYMLQYLEYPVDNDNKLVMKVYVNGKGEIKGRIIEYEDDYDSLTIRMLAPEKGRKVGYEFSVKADGESVGLIGSGKKSGKKVSGDFNVKYNGASLVNLKVKKLNTETLKKGKLNGTIEASISSKLGVLADSVSGMSILQDVKVVLTSKMTDNTVKCSLDVVYDEEDVGTVSASLKKRKLIKAKVPSSKNTIMVEDEDTLEEWIQDIDWDKWITKLDKTDLPSDLIDIIEDISDALEDGDINDINIYRSW